MSEKVQLAILVSEELRRKAKAAAALRGVTLSDVLRDALERFVAENEVVALQPDRPEEERRPSPPEDI